MSECKNTKIGIKLHAYELGMMSKDDHQEFEEHLLECSHCFEQVNRLDSAMNVLKSNQGIQHEIIQGENGIEFFKNSKIHTPKVKKVRPLTYLWVVVAAVVVLTVVYQLSTKDNYQTIFKENTNFNQQSSYQQSVDIQEIQFTQLRSSSPAVINLDKGSIAKFVIPVSLFESSDSVKVVVETIDGINITQKVLAIQRGESNISLVLSLSLFDKGLHTLKINAAPPFEDSLSLSFTFRVK